MIHVVLFVLIITMILNSLTIECALSDDADMLKAAANGDASKVIEFIQGKGVSLTTKNNNGVR